MENEEIKRGTSFEEVYDQFLLVIQDYHLDNLYKSNYNAFRIFLKSLLVRSIDLFNGALVDLSYEEVSEQKSVTNDNGDTETITVKNYYFKNTLSSKEISILAMICVFTWFERKTLDIRQMEEHLDSKSFSVKSEQANLKQKAIVLNQIRERYYHEILEYQIGQVNKLPFFGEI